MYRDYIEQNLKKEFSSPKLLKEKGNSSVSLYKHTASGQYFIVRRLSGSSDIYRRLIPVKTIYLPEIFEAASDENGTTIIEEYVKGDTVFEMLKAALFSEEETISIVSDVCRALYVLHSLDIIHRDVKPENIVLRGNNAVLLDFDASRTVKEGRNSDTVALGTTGYAAPEQFGVSQTDPRSDIYALGVTMNVMLTGEHPSVKLAGGRMGRIVSGCTMLNPDKRFQNVIKIMEAMNR